MFKITLQQILDETIAVLKPDSKFDLNGVIYIQRNAEKILNYIIQVRYFPLMRNLTLHFEPIFVNFKKVLFSYDRKEDMRFFEFSALDTKAYELDIISKIKESKKQPILCGNINNLNLEQIEFVQKKISEGSGKTPDELKLLITDPSGQITEDERYYSISTHFFLSDDQTFSLGNNVIELTIVALLTNVFGAINFGDYKEIKSYFDISESIKYDESFDILKGVVTSKIRNYIKKKNNIQSIAGRKKIEDSDGTIKEKDKIYRLADKVAKELEEEFGIQSITVENVQDRYKVTTHFPKGTNILYLADVLTKGEEKILGINALNEAGGNVKVNLNILDTLQGGVENLKNVFGNQLEVYSLITLDKLQDALAEKGYIDLYGRLDKARKK